MADCLWKCKCAYCGRFGHLEEKCWVRGMFYLIFFGSSLPCGFKVTCPNVDLHKRLPRKERVAEMERKRPRSPTEDAPPKYSFPDPEYAVPPPPENFEGAPHSAYWQPATSSPVAQQGPVANEGPKKKKGVPPHRSKPINGKGVLQRCISMGQASTSYALVEWQVAGPLTQINARKWCGSV